MIQPIPYSDTYTSVTEVPQTTATHRLLTGELSDLSVLALDGLLQLPLVLLEVSHGFLSQLQVAFHLPLGLVGLSAGLLLTLQRVLQLIQRLLQLGLHLEQVAHLVLLGAEVLGGLLLVLLGRGRGAGSVTGHLVARLGYYLYLTFIFGIIFGIIWHLAAR